MGNSFYWNPCGHTYTVASSGLKHNVDKTFHSREDANEYMYKEIAKNNLSITKVYDDKHDKTYRCGDTVSFFVQRA